jgi:alpha-L-fucosidase
MKKLIFLLIYLVSIAAIKGQTFSSKEERLEWWKDARFDMFIHWGPVSLKGTEIGWSRGGSGIPIEEYEVLYKQFNPLKFNADEWVKLAREAGMKYIVFTSKHRDGFCMWDSKFTDHNIMNSPFNRDVMKELAEACKKQGMALGFYHSTTDRGVSTRKGNKIYLHILKWSGDSPKIILPDLGMEIKKCVLAGGGKVILYESGQNIKS